VRNDVVEDKRSLTYYLKPSRLLITPITHCHITREYEQAEWVAYELKSSYLKNNDFKGLIFYKIIWSAQALQIGEITEILVLTRVIYVQLLTWNLM
jgi:hypothetical protein